MILYGMGRTGEEEARIREMGLYNIVAVSGMLQFLKIPYSWLTSAVVSKLHTVSEENYLERRI